MVDSSIHFKVVPTKSLPLLTMIQLGSAAWEGENPEGVLGNLHSRLIPTQVTQELETLSSEVKH